MPQPTSVLEFEAFVARSENANATFEWIGGEIVEVPSNPYSSAIAITIATFIRMYLFEHPIGFVTGEAAGYVVAGERYAPDVAFVAKSTQDALVQSGYNPNPPDLAVEVVSPTDTEAKLRIKIVNYLAAGTLVWVVFPAQRAVEVYRSGQPVEILGVGDTLMGEAVLPDFQLAVRDIFAGLI